MKNRIIITMIILIIVISSLSTTALRTSIKNQDKIDQLDLHNLDENSRVVIENDIDFTKNRYIINPNAEGDSIDPFIISNQNLEYITIYDTCKHFLIKDCTINVKGVGLSLSNVKNVIIQNCVFKNIENGICIFLEGSNNNIIKNCAVSSSSENIFSVFLYAYNSDDNTIQNSKISNCDYGLVFEKSNNNIVHHNDIYDNNVNAKVISGINQWDDGNGEGNYWDDYTGTDSDNNGIGDQSYFITNDNYDRFPYKNPIDKSKSKEINILNRIFQIFFSKLKTLILRYKNEEDLIKNTESKKDEKTYTVSYTTSDTHDGWIENRDGINILHLSGSNYEMGYQHGALLKEKIKQNLGAQLSYFQRTKWNYDAILNKYYEMEEKLPKKYKNEMQGMADGSGISYEDIAVLNTIPAVFNHACCEVSLWGSATENGDLYHIRGWDWSLGLEDPDTGVNLQDTQILIVRDPDDSYATLYPEFAGHIFSWGGFNEKGIAVGETSCITNDYDFDGISGAFRMRMLLDYASNSNEAIDIMTSNRTCGWNFVISDGITPEGYALEQTGSLSYVGKWDDPVEGNSPFWQIEDVVRRVPFFIDTETADTSPNRKNYDPSGISGFISYLLGKDRSFATWYFYKTISEEIEKNYGSFNLFNTMASIRQIYKGKTDFLFLLIMKIGFVNSVHQWVACPKTGDIALAFASGEKYSYENPVHRFNLYDLLNDEPS